MTARPGGRARAGGRSPAHTWLRAGLVLLAVIEVIEGAWQYFAPLSFYNDVPTVADDPRSTSTS